jgi:hypothetical protein
MVIILIYCVAGVMLVLGLVSFLMSFLRKQPITSSREEAPIQDPSNADVVAMLERQFKNSPSINSD